MTELTRSQPYGGDHHFTGHQKVEYDSLSALGRTAYDNIRWTTNVSHFVAYRSAARTYGYKHGLLSMQARPSLLARIKRAFIDPLRSSCGKRSQDP